MLSPPNAFQWLICETLRCRQYQLALHQIELLRKDGRFHGADGLIPEGQGIVMAHLNECHELIEMVRYIDCRLPLVPTC